ncbi:hypothetical protein SORBI_3001G224500 [Sorghum bicolor]|uniref:Uncharacterized protein n=1 Tax=Sorghum bicolor TaxID=4558 RepID=A0A1B6QKE1_SORBI|nr:hypothetical protein SORBI_3001G224500 [Sorghum bicolor]
MEMTMARGSPDNTQHPSPHEPQLHIFFWFSSSPVLHPIPASISIPLPPALRRSPVASYLPASSVHHPHPFSAHPSPPRHWPPPPAMCIATPLPAHNPNRRSPAPITRRPFQLPPPPVSPPPLPPPPTITTKATGNQQSGISNPTQTGTSPSFNRSSLPHPHPITGICRQPCPAAPPAHPPPLSPNPNRSPQPCPAAPPPPSHSRSPSPNPNRRRIAQPLSPRCQLCPTASPAASAGPPPLLRPEMVQLPKT